MSLIEGKERAGNGNGADGGAARARRPIRPRGSLVAALDIGTTKICCFIARVEADKPRVLGIGHQVSRGVRNGRIIDLEAAGASVVAAVHAAEEMAGEQIDEVVANLSGGFAASRIVKAEIAITGREISEAELQQVL
jgi:cell division protein FtsA